MFLKLLLALLLPTFAFAQSSLQLIDVDANTVLQDVTSDEIDVTQHVNKTLAVRAQWPLQMGLADYSFTLSAVAANNVLVVPGAQGYGVHTVAGSGRHVDPAEATVYVVTSLADNGAGTLRECIAASGARTCVFQTYGTIALDSDLVVTNPYLTIAGQTAPHTGITITRGTLRIFTHDVLVQHLAIRPGDSAQGSNPGSRDGVTLDGSSSPVYNVVLDHLSLTWALDENFSTYGDVSDVTLSNSIIAEGLLDSIHPKGKHSMGMLIGAETRRLTIINNLLAHNNDRNPRVQAGAQLDFVNNVVYNWGGTSAWNTANVSGDDTGNPTFLNFVNNYYKRGLTGAHVPVVYAASPAAGTRVYAAGNIGPTRPDGTGDEWLISGLPVAHKADIWIGEYNLVDVLSATDAYEYVLDNAGALPKRRSAIDARIAKEVRDGTGLMKSCVECSHALPATPTALNGDYTDFELWLSVFD